MVPYQATINGHYILTITTITTVTAAINNHSTATITTAIATINGHCTSTITIITTVTTAINSHSATTTTIRDFKIRRDSCQTQAEVHFQRSDMLRMLTPSS